MKTHILATVKVVAALALLWGIGTAIVTLSPDGEVQTAKATVTDFVPKHLIADNAFGKMLEDRGMQPRAFDFNGNTVYFATQQVHGKPSEVAASFQRDMVRRGINKKVHTLEAGQGVISQITPDKAQKIQDALAAKDPQALATLAGPAAKLSRAQLTGDVVPIQRVGDFYVSMAGIVRKDKSQKTDDQVMEEWVKSVGNKELGVEKLSEGLRFIDVMAEGPNRSLVTATWADKGFDFNKIKPGYSGPGASPDPDVPSCMGCTRLFRLHGLSEDEMTTNQFITSYTPEETERFYRSTLTNRGWKLAKAQTTLSKLDTELVAEGKHENKRLLAVERDGLTLLVTFEQTEEGDTIVTATKEHRGIPALEFGDAKRGKVFKQGGLMSKVLE